MGNKGTGGEQENVGCETIGRQREGGRVGEGIDSETGYVDIEGGEGEGGEGEEGVGGRGEEEEGEGG